MQYRINLIKPLTDTVLQLLLQPSSDQRLNYTAGQYLEIHLAGGEHCPFSIANAPLGANQIELHIRHTHDNPFTVKLFDEIKQHGEITISGPFGQCTYHNPNKRPTLLLAGGTGFAPIKAIIEHALADGEPSPMHLYWGAKNVSDLYLDDLTEHWHRLVEHFTYTPVLSAAEHPEQWHGQHGFIQQVIANDYQDLRDCQVYAAGPPDMIQATYNTCLQLGLDKNYFYSDYDL